MLNGKPIIVAALIGAVASIIVSFITAWTTIATSEGRIKKLQRTAIDLKSHISSIPAPIGAIFAYGGPVDQSVLEKEGWMLCDGRELSRSEFSQLFGRIGELWGKGNTVGTFNIPDLRGYFLRGADNGAGIDPDVSARINKDESQVGDKVGTLQGMATAAPGESFTADDSGKHKHGDPTWNGDPGPYELATEHRGPGDADFGDQSAPTTEDGSHVHSIIGGDKETRPINAYVNWIIRVR